MYAFGTAHHERSSILIINDYWWAGMPTLQDFK